MNERANDRRTSRGAADPIDRTRRAVLRATASGGTVRAEGAVRLDLHVVLRAIRGQVEIRSGTMGLVCSFHGRLVSGDPRAFNSSAGGYLGPIARARRGRRVCTGCVNRLRKQHFVA